MLSSLILGEKMKCFGSLSSQSLTKIATILLCYALLKRQICYPQSKLRSSAYPKHVEKIIESRQSSQTYLDNGAKT